MKISPKFKEFLLRWLISTASVLVVTCLRADIHGTPAGIIVATFLLSLLNMFVRPLLMLLSLPLMVITLGLFRLVINAALLYVVGRVMNHYSFEVETFRAAFWGAILIGLFSLILNMLTGAGSGRVRVRRTAPPKPTHHDDGDGPIIDI